MRHITTAIERCRDLPHAFAVHRVPFFLEPSYLDEPEDFRESHTDRMVRKFGSLEAFERFKASHGLVPRAGEVGLGWTEEALGARVQSATLRSQRLVQWAAHRHSLAAAEALYAGLSRRHFTEGAALNDTSVLADVAVEAGLERQSALAFLASEEGTDEVLAAFERTTQLGIHSIPTLVVDGRIVLSGAARADEVEKALRGLGTPSGNQLFADCLAF